MFDADSDREQEAAAWYEEYIAAGSHADIGRRLGERYGTFGPAAAQMHAEHVAFARACRAEVARAYPAIVEEMDAQAEAAGRSGEDVLWHYCLGAGSSPPQENGVGGGAAASPGCSTVGVMTEEGPVVARNYDFFYFEKWRHLVTTVPDGALSHTGMWPGLLGGRYDGVNEAGVWISIHGGGCRVPRRLRPGIAFHHLCRLVLETCSTAREAVERLCSAPHIASYNYFIADAHEMYVVEAHPEQTAVRTPNDGVLVCTNHPLHPRLTPLAASPILDNSRRRAEFLQRGAEEIVAREMSLEGAAEAAGRQLQRLMGDHTVPVCGHVDGLATFWSAVCAPRRRRVWYSRGAPCRNEYKSARWPGKSAGR